MKRRAIPPVDGTTWDFNLPDKLKIAIADAIVVFARLETITLETVWIFEDSTLEEKKDLTRDWVTKNFRKIKRVVRLIPEAKTDKIWPTLEHLAAERNLIAHGFWSVDNAGRPTVLSHKFLESEDYVTGEIFDYARFEYFQKRADHMLNTFRLFKTMLDEMPKEDRIAAGFTLPKKPPKSLRRRVVLLFQKLWARLTR